MTRDEVIKNLKEQKAFIETRYLNRKNIFEYLYTPKKPITEYATYFCSRYNNIVWGDFTQNISFISKDGKKDYLLFSANSGYALPQQIAIGSEVDGRVYLIREHLPSPSGMLSTFIIPDSNYFDKDSSGFLPRKKDNHIAFYTAEADITDEDLLCIDVAIESANRIGKVLKLAKDYKK